LTAGSSTRLAELPLATLERLLGDGQLGLTTGPFCFCVRSTEKLVVDNLRLLYAQHFVQADPEFADFHVSVERPYGLRHWVAPQAEFRLDGFAPFLSLPAAQAFPMLEWGMNWCIASHSHQYLVLHAAVLARGDDAVLLPAPPGAGKSTLCAGLAYGGWRLLSDELALIDPASLQVFGLARPINLKNASIDVIRAYVPEAPINVPVPDTKKGTVAHVAPPRPAVDAADRPARLRWVVTPRYVPDAKLTSWLIPRPETMAMLIDNAFNYDVLGVAGFDALTTIVTNVDTFDLQYSRLDDARQWFDELG
jgi:HprK-related kinase A